MTRWLRAEPILDDCQGVQPPAAEPAAPGWRMEHPCRSAESRLNELPQIATEKDARVAFQNDAESSAVSPDSPIVFVIDDDPSVRESLELLIYSAGWQPETFDSAQAFLRRARAPVPSCLILDIALPGLNGLDLQQRLAADRNDLPIILISGLGDISMTVRAMKAGAVDFLTKPFGNDALLSAVQNAIERSKASLRREAEMGLLQHCYTTLSRRERQVMALVVSGLMNKQVGFELGISEITVKAHRGQAMRKMKADSLADLVKMATKLGIAPAAYGRATA